MAKLYELTSDYRGLLTLDLDEQTMADTLEAIDGAIEDKAENICKVLVEMQGNMSAVELEITRLVEKVKLENKRHDHLKAYLLNSMEATDKKKIETPLFTVTSVAGRDKVNVLEEGSIPMDYFNEVPASWKLDKKDLLDALKKGDVDGAELIKGKSSLRIK